MLEFNASVRSSDCFVAAALLEHALLRVWGFVSGGVSLSCLHTTSCSNHLGYISPLAEYGVANWQNLLPDEPLLRLLLCGSPRVLPDSSLDGCCCAGSATAQRAFANTPKSGLTV